MYDCFEYNGTLTEYPSKTNWFWITHNHNNYSSFNFDYTVPWWEESFIQVFGDQYTKDSKTYLVSKQHTLESPRQYHENVVERIKPVPIYHASGLVPHEGEHVRIYNNLVESNTNPDNTMPEDIRIFSNLFNFLKRISNKTDAEYIWVTASICDYQEFDFCWHPDVGEENYIHAWPSPNNKQGYTFYVPLKKFNEQKDTLQKLEWFDTIKVRDDVVHVRPLPINVFDIGTSCAEAIKNHEFTHHYEWFVEATNPMKDVLPDHYPSRWDDINIDVFGKNKNVLCVPREAKSYIVDQVYDYPHIKYYSGKEIKSKFPIYFFSYQETNADENYNKLLDRGLEVIRRHDTEGIGMANAYKKAAKECSAPYFWAVFAKSQVHPDFKFDFEPDRLAETKCYAFDSYIPINGLTYGGYGVKLYPTVICRNIEDWGIDFSMSMPFEHVKILSTIAEFNQTPYMTWRSAFRECAKLSAGLYKNSKRSDDKKRLDTWCSVANGKNSSWCLAGANIGKQFGSNKNMQELMCLYDERWLKEKFISLYDDLESPSVSKLDLDYQEPY